MHPHCGAGTYIYVEDGKYIPITRFIDVEGLFEYLSEVAKKYDHTTINELHVTAAIASHLTQFIDAKKAKSVDVKKLLINALTKGTEDVIKEFHRKTLFLGTMHFQDPTTSISSECSAAASIMQLRMVGQYRFVVTTIYIGKSLSASFRCRLRSGSSRMLICDLRIGIG